MMRCTIMHQIIIQNESFFLTLHLSTNSERAYERNRKSGDRGNRHAHGMHEHQTPEPMVNAYQTDTAGWGDSWGDDLAGDLAESDALNQFRAGMEGTMGGTGGGCSGVLVAMDAPGVSSD
jgi:hypothetical protein